MLHRPSRTPLRLVLSAVLLLVLGVACIPQAEDPQATTPPAPTFPLELTDDEGVTTELAKDPQHIVTWGPSLTEILFALDQGDSVVGVSGDFDNFPAEAKTIDHIGGANFQPNVETIVSLEADLVIDGFGGGEEWKGRLREQDIPVFTVQADTFDDLLHDIQSVGRLAGATRQADDLVADMSKAERTIADRIGAEPPATCFFEVGFQGGFFTVGPGSFIYDLLQKAGCDPVTSDAKDAFPQWSVEALLDDDPDVYLVSSESGSSVSAVEKRQGFGALAAVKEHRVFLIDSDLISRAGPRVVDGLEALAQALHPDAG
jgi:iron complex transport system substrate-binding protein